MSPDGTACFDVVGEPLICEGPPAKLLGVQADDIDEKGALDVDGPLAHLHVALVQEAAALQLLDQPPPLGGCGVADGRDGPVQVSETGWERGPTSGLGLLADAWPVSLTLAHLGAGDRLVCVHNNIHIRHPPVGIFSRAAIHQHPRSLPNGLKGRLLHFPAIAFQK